MSKQHRLYMEKHSLFGYCLKSPICSFPASTLIDVVSDSEQAKNLAQLSTPCRLCRGISNLCGVSEKKWEKEIRDICSAEQATPYCLQSGRVKMVLLWTVFEETYSEITTIARVKQRQILTHEVKCNPLNETGTDYHLSRLSPFWDFIWLSLPISPHPYGGFRGTGLQDCSRDCRPVPVPKRVGSWMSGCLPLITCPWQPMREMQPFWPWVAQ